MCERVCQRLVVCKNRLMRLLLYSPSKCELTFFLNFNLKLVQIDRNLHKNVHLKNLCHVLNVFS